MVNKDIFENPEYIEENKEKGHSMSLGFNTIEGAINPNIESPYKILLNGQWRFYHQMGLGQLPNFFYETNFNDGHWDWIQVPSLWQLKGYSKPYYLAFAYPPAIETAKRKIPSIKENQNEVGIYRRTFTLDNYDDNRYYFLHLEGVKAAFNVYLNGQKIGYSQGSMTPAEFDISNILLDGKNQITVEVYRYSDGTYLEDQDMWFLSGIFRDVYIYSEPYCYLKDYFARCSFDKNYENALYKMDLDFVSKETIIIDLYVTLKGESEEILFKRSIQLNVNDSVKLYFDKWINQPKKWNAETPNLYNVVIELRELNGRTIQVKSFKFGFRETEIKDSKLLINGESILLKGVNRHDFDPYEGWYVPDKRYIQDLKIMKQNNINAIRASHYPNDLRFYKLCDEMGFYVMDEAEVETHGVRNKNVPGSNPIWKKAVVDRMERMVLRDRNFACIFMWSLGNEAGHGDNFKYMKEAAKNIDDTRPFHYEGDYDLSVTDVLSRMYPTVELLEKIGKNEEVTISIFDNVMNKLAADHKPIKKEWMAGKPVIVCEYAHAMENSLGNFQEYMDVFEKYEKMAGGFIWDFVDQSIIQENNGVKKYLYGGDFGEEVSHRYFCANGIVDSERNPHPSLVEVKKVYQSIQVDIINLKELKFRLVNKYDFITLNFLDIYCSYLVNGEIIEQIKINHNSLMPKATIDIEVPFDKIDLVTNQEVIVEFSFQLNKNQFWAEKGYEIAFEQFIYNHYSPLMIDSPDGNIDLSEKDDLIKIKSEEYDIIINKRTGQFKSIDLGNGNILVEDTQLNFWRAYTDNDYGYVNFKPGLERILMRNKWQKASDNYQVKSYNLSKSNGKIILHFDLKTYGFKDLFLEYIIHSTEGIEIKMTGYAKKELVRFGYQIKIKNQFNQLTWYGRGPEENYCDRKTGSKLGLYNSTIDEFPHNYMRPQENGYRSDIRYFKFRDSNNFIFLKDLTGEGFGLSAWPYSQEDLQEAKHIHELPRRNYINVNIDNHQKGVGGDLPGVANIHEPYKLKAKEIYKFHILLGGNYESE